MHLKRNFKKTLVLATAAFLITSSTLQAAQPLPQENYNWNLKEFFNSKADWNSAYKKVETQYLPKLSKYNGKLNAPSELLNYFKLKEEASIMVENIYVYANLNSDLDSTNSEAYEMVSLAETLLAKLGTTTSFETPELLSLSEDTLKNLTTSPLLTPYKHYLDTVIYKKAHTLTKEEEALIATFGELSSIPDDIYTQAKSSDLRLPTIIGEKGEKVQLTNGNYSLFLENPNREIRKNAFEGMFGAYEGSKNTLAATLNAEVKKNVVFAKATRYNSALESALDNSYIPTDFYDNLVNSVNKNLEGLHHYVSLKKKYLGVDKVHFYDMYVPLIDDYKMDIPYEEGKQMILTSLAPLGDTYINDLKKALDSNWADVYEKPNKYSGAYNWGTYTSHPYVLLNYNGSLDSVLTVGHEFGHAMNSYYTNKKQPYIYADTPIFTAEVASTANEMIITEYMIEHAKSDEEKLYLINQYIENIRGTIYTQVMYAEFEKAIHETIEKGGALSADTLCTIWGNLMNKYYGSDFETDELAKLWWARISHFYMNFYVYQYATGMSAAYKLSQGVLSNDPQKLQFYLDFLASGCSDYPIETLKTAGVDMLSSEPIDALLEKFNSLVTEMETLMQKTGKLN